MNINNLTNQVLRIDAFLPPEMALKAEQIGITKAAMGPRNTFALGVLAGAFIALGAIFATAVSAGAGSHLSYGITKLISGIAFCLGLILVIVGGAELFTGNNLIIMAWANRRISTMQVLRNWVLVYLGNFVGSIATVLWMFASEQYAFGNGSIGINILDIANSKCGLGFIQAIALGIGCNALVCLAVWLCFSAHSTTDKILSIIFPISAFVTAGFEHCVANMYFIPAGLLVKAWAPVSFWTTIGSAASEYTHLTWQNFFLINLLPVTIGNILGGSVLVSLAYWFIYIRKRIVPQIPKPHLETR